MKLGSNCSIFNIYGDEKFRKMKEFGFDYVDYSIEGELGGKSEEEYTREILRQNALADEAGVVIWQVHGPWRFPPHDETEELRAGRAEVMWRSIRHTAMIGCRYWVIHPLMPFGWVDDFQPEEFRKINLDFFRKLLPYAKEHGVVICFENMPMRHLSISTPEKTLDFIHEMNDENFRFCLDTGHCSVFGIQPADAVRMAGADLKVMHVHDNLGKNDDHMVPFSGVIDWKEYRKALDEIGFDGVFSLEAGWKGFLDSASNDLKLQLLKAIADDIIQ